MSDSLFVYGTLLPGRENDHVLAPLGGCWETAFLRGTLYPRGIGKALGYPALILDAAGDEIQGQLLQSRQLAQYWGRLDQFEGPAYQRVQTSSVRRQDDSHCTAYVYVLREC